MDLRVSSTLECVLNKSLWGGQRTKCKKQNICSKTLKSFCQKRLMVCLSCDYRSLRLLIKCPSCQLSVQRRHAPYPSAPDRQVGPSGQDGATRRFTAHDRILLNNQKDKRQRSRNLQMVPSKHASMLQTRCKTTC